MTNTTQTIAAIVLLLSLVTRIALPPYGVHLPNFSAVDALALFCGAYFSKRSLAIVIMLLSVWVSDIWINTALAGHWVFFYPGWYWQYAAYVIITLVGSAIITSVTPSRVFASCLASSTLFFAISNFGVWCSGLLYPLTFQGLVACYVTAIPFFQNTLFSDLFFALLLFGSVTVLQRSYLTLLRR